jgi:hypothetical protein
MMLALGFYMAKKKVEKDEINLDRYFNLLEAIGKSEPAGHAKAATKEVLLAMRGVLDVAIGALEMGEKPKKKGSKKFKIKLS